MKHVVRLVAAGGGAVTFGSATDPFSDGFGFVDVLVTIEAEGLSAQAWVRTIEDDTPLSLRRFLFELADDWKGTEASRTWESVEHQLKIRCHRGRLGDVTLIFTLRGSHRADSWLAEASVTVEAGEEMAKLARDVEQLLRM
jgi:hypothetical protein